MQLVQLIIPAEAAHDTVYQLGEVRATAHSTSSVLTPCRAAARAAHAAHTPTRHVYHHCTCSPRAVGSCGLSARTGFFL